MRNLILLSVLMVSLCANCQEERKVVYPFYAFVGGEMDYVLFPQDEKGNVRFADTIRTSLTKEQIANSLALWLYDIEHIDNVEVDDVLSIDGALRFDVELPAGIAYVSLPFQDILIEKPGSEIEFSVSIVYGDNEMVYNLRNFETHRRRIAGEAKENGKPNLIHWQRVNALKKESEEFKDKKSKRAQDSYKEKIDQIEIEKEQYQAEYDAVMSFIDGLSKLCNPQ